MRGHRLGLIFKNNAKLIGNIFWVLNSDATHVAGKIYTWVDASPWADINNFKG